MLRWIDSDLVVDAGAIFQQRVNLCPIIRMLVWLQWGNIGSWIWNKSIWCISKEDKVKVIHIRDCMHILYVLARLYNICLCHAAKTMNFLSKEASKMEEFWCSRKSLLSATFLHRISESGFKTSLFSASVEAHQPSASDLQHFYVHIKLSWCYGSPAELWVVLGKNPGDWT